MGYIPEILPKFYPGKVGGVAAWGLHVNSNFGTNPDVNGAFNPGKIWVTGTYYKHPNGTRHTIASMNSSGYTEFMIHTVWGKSIGPRYGIGYLIWTEEPILTRWPTWNWNEGVSYLPLNICSAVYRSGVWYAVDNNNVEFAFTPEEDDVLLGQFEANTRAFGINYFMSYVDNDSGLSNDLATPAENNYVMCERTGSKILPSDLRTQWDGLQVRSKSYDKKHPLEFVRAKPEKFKHSPSPLAADLDGNELYPNGVQLSDLDP